MFGTRVRRLVDGRLFVRASRFLGQGLKTGDAFDELYRQFDRIGGTHRVVCDEIDHLEDANTLLDELPRARANGHIIPHCVKCSTGVTLAFEQDTPTGVRNMYPPYRRIAVASESFRQMPAATLRSSRPDSRRRVYRVPAEDADAYRRQFRGARVRPERHRFRRIL